METRVAILERRGSRGGAEGLVSILVHFGNLGFHFSSFWKPWFPFYFILETLVSILDHFGNLSFHFRTFWKPKEGERRGSGGGAEGERRGSGGGAEGCRGGDTPYSCTSKS